MSTLPLIKKYRTFTTVGALSNSMAATHNHEAFAAFKAVLRSCFSISDFDLRKKFCEQDSVKKKKFISKMVVTDPTLDRYEDCWPIEAYYDLYIPSCRSRPTQVMLDFQRSRNTRAARSRTSKRMPGVSTFAGKTPPRNFIPPRSTNPLLADAAQGNIAYVPETLHEPSHASPVVQLQDTYSASSSATPHIGERRSSPETERSADNLYPVACHQCGRLPYIRSELNSQLTEALHGLEHFIPVLGMAGLIHNMHLQQFGHWEASEQKAFIDALPATQVSLLDKHALLSRLRANADAALGKRNRCEEPDMHTSLSTAIQNEILMPPLYEIQRLVDPQNPLTFLMHAMGMEFDAFYGDFVKTIDIMARHYLFEPKPISDYDDEGELKLLIQAIYARRPAWGRYENDWAIRIFLKRRLQDRHESGSQLRQNTQNAQNFVSQPTDALFITPILRQSQTPVVKVLEASLGTDDFIYQPRLCDVPHAYIDFRTISPKMQNFLKQEGMEELIPALVSNIGIYNDDQFDNFCMLPNEVRMELFSGTSALSTSATKITTFQFIMLKVAFQGRKGCGKSEGSP